MNGEKSKVIFNAVLAFSLSIVISSLILGWSYKNKTDGDESIAVTGSAKKRITSDLVTWRAGVNYQATELSNAYKKLSVKIPEIKKYLIEKGINEDEITVSSISSSTLHPKDENGNSTSAISGYSLSQNLFIRSNEVKKVEKIARESTELLERGILLASDSPEYYYTKLSDLKVEMLGEAAENAKTRADQIANSTGNSIGTIRSARMGVMQITAAESTEVSDYGINDTSSIEKDVTAVVKASFAVN